MIDFLHSFTPHSILYQIGPVKIYWYGLFTVLGIFFGILVVMYLARRYGFSRDDVYDLAFFLVIFGLIGARVYAVLLFPQYYFVEHPIEILQVWRGGMAIHGAIFAGILTLLIWCRKRGFSFWQWADIIAPSLALGQAVGRWGNYFNQELFGKPTDLPWGIPIDLLHRPFGYEKFEFFHPTFLYESLLNVLIFLILFAFHLYRLKRKHQPHASEKQTSVAESKFSIARRCRLFLDKQGIIALLYLVLYSLVRISMEQFRIDETPEFFGIRLPIIVSVGIIVVAVLFSVLKTEKQHGNVG